jgi:hypothetical protein
MESDRRWWTESKPGIKSESTVGPYTQPYIQLTSVHIPSTDKQRELAIMRMDDDEDEDDYEDDQDQDQDQEQEQEQEQDQDNEQDNEEEEVWSL